MKTTRIKFFLFCLLNCLYCSPKLLSQILLFEHSDTLKNANHLSQVFDKQFNIYRYTNSFSYIKELYKTEFGISNEYEGFLIRGNENSKKDGEKFNFYISQNLFSFLKFFTDVNYLLNSDSKTIGLNEAEKLNLNVGSSFVITNFGKSFISYGIEKNKQVSIYQQGPRFAFGLRTEKINITDVNLNTNFFWEKVKLKDGRKSSTITFETFLDGKFEEGNSIFLALDYQNIQRDYVVFPIYLNNFFESRLENKIFPTFGLNYNLFDKTFVSFTGRVYSYKIQRFYNLFDPTNQYTAVERTLYEQSFDLNFELFAQSKYFSPKLGFSYFYRNEENALNKRFDIDIQTFSQLSTTEFQKNNYQTRLKLFYNLIFYPSSSNMTTFSGNVGILRYDTPSTLNDDDRDEFQFFTSLSTRQQISKHYALSLALDVQMFHLVFLKSSHSSLNNWNRIIKLSASNDFQTENFVWKPTFEIFSNYLVYDFETSATGIQSYAFRQFVYKDTLQLFLSKNISFSAFLVYKYSERGTLYWKDFAMTKELDIKELFAKTMLYYNHQNKVQFGFGARAYNITQKPIGKRNLPESYSYYSLSPETEIKIFLSKNNVIFLQGWYELKFLNYKIVGENPNLMLTTMVNL